MWPATYSEPRTATLRSCLHPGRCEGSLVLVREAIHTMASVLRGCRQLCPRRENSGSIAHTVAFHAHWTEAMAALRRSYLRTSLSARTSISSVHLELRHCIESRGELSLIHCRDAGVCTLDATAAGLSAQYQRSGTVYQVFVYVNCGLAIEYMDEKSTRPCLNIMARWQ
ncbi:uncharacterized protein BDZ99DRAFT_312369 [Mytilinidion resinicola]|uniref:Uncharacterized protein n=1 Tax=Mytilinidion resinicola TaxID=574789 RepID=A0A6A6YNK7_9PEZI|nr:uncharacterized protein BDZ99DRAFT_312369 [Mytilinidion resinicola]KAF2810452.1 hypothetical protein BDZ99DRAFT_312369 [Mytilinidion resinicola]